MAVAMKAEPKKPGDRVFHPEFARRMQQAADGNSNVPPINYGRLSWVKEQFNSRFKADVSLETIRKWFAGETKPRAQTLHMLAEILGVDEAWLALGSTNKATVKEQRIRNAVADASVNIVAGLVQADGGHPAFPDEGDRRAEAARIDLYAIIKGAQYGFHVATAERVKEGWEFAVPIAALESIVLGVILTHGFQVTILELDAEGLEENGKRKSGLIEVAVGEDLKTGPKVWRRVTSFAERL
jgi:transcriptional regulator with XRE-family HTH domain